jgi:hypothetical protein
MAQNKLKVAIYKNNGETTTVTVNESDFDHVQIAKDIKDPKVDSVLIGRNTYKTHMIQSVEVIEE